MDPYGGPHAQRVVAARNAHLTSQWFAEQGFAVVVVDGRGTPGRGPTFERAVWGDLAGPVLDDQVDALHALAADHPDLDLTRVGIRGWSFGGYLAALAVASVMIAVKYRSLCGLWAGAASATMHMSWSLGLIAQMLKRRA